MSILDAPGATLAQGLLAGTALQPGVIGAANGVAGLDATSKIPVAQVPALSYATTAQGALAATALQPAVIGAANGVAGLDATSKIPVAQVPALSYATTAQGALAATAVQPSGLTPYRLQTNTYTVAPNSTATVFPANINSISYGQRIDFTWKPPTSSGAVCPANLTNFVIDTSLASTAVGSHGIGSLTWTTVQGGGYCDLSFGNEVRFTMAGASTAGTFIGTKYVFEPDTTNSGTCVTFITEQMDNMVGSVSWISKFQRNYLDPRMTTYHAGGHVHTPQILSGNYTFSDADSGKLFLLNTASNATWTIPSTVTDGFEVRCVQGALGGTITLVSGGRTVLNNASRVTSQFAWDECTVIAAASSTYLYYDWKDPLPTQVLSNSAVVTTASTTRATYLTANLEANSTYEIHYDAAFTTTATAQSASIGIASTATGALFMINAGVQISTTAGAANVIMNNINSTAGFVSGTGSVASSEQNAYMKGKIITSSTAGTFSIQGGAISTATTLSFVANKSILYVKKIK